MPCWLCRLNGSKVGSTDQPTGSSSTESCGNLSGSSIAYHLRKNKNSSVVPGLIARICSQANIDNHLMVSESLYIKFYQPPPCKQKWLMGLEIIKLKIFYFHITLILGCLFSELLFTFLSPIFYSNGRGPTNQTGLSGLFFKYLYFNITNLQQYIFF